MTKVYHGMNGKKKPILILKQINYEQQKSKIFLINYRYR